MTRPLLVGLPLGTLLVLGQLGLQCHLLFGCITCGADVNGDLYLSLFKTCTNRVIGVLLSDELH